MELKTEFNNSINQVKTQLNQIDKQLSESAFPAQTVMSVMTTLKKVEKELDQLYVKRTYTTEEYEILNNAVEEILEEMSCYDFNDLEGYFWQSLEDNLAFVPIQHRPLFEEVWNTSPEVFRSILNKFV